MARSCPQVRRHRKVVHNLKLPLAIEQVFDYSGVMDAPTHLPPADSGPPPAAVGAWDPAAFAGGVEGLVQVCSDTELVDLIRTLEDVKNACSAGQARAAVALRKIREESAANQREREAARRGTVNEIALARRESPHRAGILLGLATVLTTELPHTMAALSEGRISEWRAALVARETACLERKDRLAVDRGLAAGLEGLSDREIVARAKEQAYALDPHSVVARMSRAHSDRRVTIRPAPDCMTVVSALLPAAQGVAAYAALLRTAESARAAGDARGKGQIMADTFVTRVTGQSSPEAVPVEVQVVISDEALLGESDTPARLVGHGPIPAGVARGLVSHDDSGTAAWIRRLYARPDDGRLVAMESHRRLFPAGLRRFIATRDGGTCRTPWCGAPIAHIDHVTPVRGGGPTSVQNGQGLCARCNQAKEAPGWEARAEDDTTITLTTPTGQRYSTQPPPLPHETAPGARSGVVPVFGAEDSTRSASDRAVGDTVPAVVGSGPDGPVTTWRAGDIAESGVIASGATTGSTTIGSVTSGSVIVPDDGAAAGRDTGVRRTSAFGNSTGAANSPGDGNDAESAPDDWRSGARFRPRIRAPAA